MKKEFVIVHDTETDNWFLEPNEKLGVNDPSYVRLIDIIIKGFEMIDTEGHVH